MEKSDQFEPHRPTFLVWESPTSMAALPTVVVGGWTFDGEDPVLYMRRFALREAIVDGDRLSETERSVACTAQAAPTSGRIWHFTTPGRRQRP